MNTARFERRADVETRQLDGAAVLVLADQHLYFGINRVGARIWEMLGEPHSLDTVVATLTRQFEIAEPACRQEAEAFIQQLVERGLARQVP